MGRSGWGARARLVLVAFGAMIASADGVVAQAAGDDLPQPVDLPAELDAVLRGYETSWRAQDAAGLAALFAEDGYALRPGRPPVRGREALRRVYAGSGGPLVLRAYAWEAEGNVAYVIGGFAPFEDGPDVGKFVLTLRRGPSGWLITADIDNGNG